MLKYVDILKELAWGYIISLNSLEATDLSEVSAEYCEIILRSDSNKFFNENKNCYYFSIPKIVNFLIFM